MSTLSENLKEIRTYRKLSMNKLAELSGVNKSTISEIESGKILNPATSTLQKLSNTLCVTINELLSSVTNKDLDNLNSKLDVQQLAKDAILYDVVNIPILGNVRAGEPILAQENITGYNPVLKSILCTEKNYFYLRVQGDSMNQEFNEGDLLLIEQTDYIENGDIAVVLIDGQDATVKKVIKNENMVTLIPMSNNPKYVPHMYDVVKDEIKIIGKVIQATKIY